MEELLSCVLEGGPDRWNAMRVLADFLEERNLDGDGARAMAWRWMADREQWAFFLIGEDEKVCKYELYDEELDSTPIGAEYGDIPRSLVNFIGNEDRVIHAAQCRQLLLKIQDAFVKGWRPCGET